MALLLRHAFVLFFLFYTAAIARADLVLISQGQPQSVILTKPNPLGYVQLAAQELQQHLKRMAGATVPIDVVGSEANYPGRRFIYVGASTATTAAGINLAGLELEYYTVRVVGNNLYIVGRDGGDDVWYDLTDCQPGTLFGVYHFLGEVLHVRWLWPGETGISVPAAATVSIPALSITSGPSMAQRKFRTPRVGLYLGGAATYGFGVPVLPTDSTRKQELAMDDLLWLRRQRMGSRKKPGFGHYFTNWWSLYGASHPEYFAVLLPGRTQPHPAADRTKQHVSSQAVWEARIAEWTAGGSGSSVNICPTDSRSFCVCSACLAWDRPAQDPETVFSSSEARLSDRYARFYTEIANRVKVINPNATVYGYAYDVYKRYPLEATIPSNLALAYVPGAPSAVVPDAILETEQDILGWIAHGCTQMYLRPNWMLAGHAGPFWPTRRLGNHLRSLFGTGNIKGFDSDSSTSSYASFGLYYYLICRMIADPTLTPEAILEEYCSAFGSAANRVRDYFEYWETFINNQADGGNTEILGWSVSVPAYSNTYDDYAFDGALQILDSAYALLGPGDAAIRDRLDFLRIGCWHGRLTAKAIAQVDAAVPLSNNPKASSALRSLLAFRNQYAESFAVWREWMIDRESFVPGMEAYWTQIFATPEVGNGTNLGAFVPVNDIVTIEAENYTAAYSGTGAAAGFTWQNITAPGAVGTAMQALPNSSTNADTGIYGPRLDYRIDFRTAGTYYGFVRMPALPGTDDSINVGLDGTSIVSNVNNTSGAFRWRSAGTGGAITLNIATPGVHTLNIWMREDGTVIDRIYLAPASSLPFPIGDNGPGESSQRPLTGEHTLVVGNGSGDGNYGVETLVPITAKAPKAGYVFDRWIGATSYVASATSASTYFAMPSFDARIDATYKIDPTLDSDHDGIADAWEMTQFGNLTKATAMSDFDQDGVTDAAEFLAGTLPKDSASKLEVLSVTPTGADRLAISWRGVAGKTYTVFSKLDLQDAGWLPVVIDVPGMAPVTSVELSLREPNRFYRIQQQ